MPCRNTDKSAAFSTNDFVEATFYIPRLPRSACFPLCCSSLFVLPVPSNMHSRKNNPALSIVGADLRVCPGRGVRRDTGADTQVCPYDKHHKIFAPLLSASSIK